MRKKKSKIKYFDLWGLRKEKYKFLETHDIKNTEWQELKPKEPRYFFTPKELDSNGNYQKFISLQDIFTKSSTGVKTHRDNFILDYSKENLKRRLSMFSDNHLDDEHFDLKDTGTWKIREAREAFRREGIKEELFGYYNYRPFDVRWIYQDKHLIERMRSVDIWNVNENNPALIMTKQLSTYDFRHSFISQFPSDICSVSLQTKESAYIFPLYLYSNKQLVFRGQKHLDISGVQKELDEGGSRKSNIKTEVIQKLSGIYKKQISDEEIFYYIYGILYSNTYRRKYNEFLKIDFPKIPFSKDSRSFFKVSNLGKELADLHLLKSKRLEKVIGKFPVSTGNILTEGKVKKREYNSKEKQIYINDKQYFEGVEPEVWNYYIGGYQILDKWLKDRIGRTLSPEDVNHYLKVITAIKNTIDLQKEIDKVYPEIERKLINSNKDEKGQRIRTPNR